MYRHWEAFFASVGLGASAIVAHVHQIAGLVIALFTLFILAIRAKREWKYRNDPPTNKEDK